MLNIKDTLSRLKQNARNKITNSAQKFKENFSEAKSKPRSKRKYLLVGFTTVIGIFGITQIARVLPAVAQDLPKQGATPGEVCPSGDPKKLPSEEIIGGLAGAAGTVSALAISSGSFMIGAVCGLIIVVVILKAQGK